MVKVDHKQEMLAMIDRLLKGEWSVSEFEQAYYDYYLDVPDEAFTHQDTLFFGEIQEKLDWCRG